MSSSYKTVFKSGEDEVIINKSRFIGYGLPIETEEEALAFIQDIKTKHKDASHNVYAYVLGENSNVQRFNDDGEPSGTAGIPALEVIKKEDLKNTLVIVTRYFGGVKLGAGGLIRAYTKAAKLAIESSIIVDMVLHENLKISLDYTLYGKIENYLIGGGYIVNDTVFDEKVNIFVSVIKDSEGEFSKEVTNLTNGNADIEKIGIVYVPIKDGKKMS